MSAYFWVITNDLKCSCFFGPFHYTFILLLFDFYWFLFMHTRFVNYISIMWPVASSAFSICFRFCYQPSFIKFMQQIRSIFSCTVKIFLNIMQTANIYLACLILIAISYVGLRSFSCLLVFYLLVLLLSVS